MTLIRKGQYGMAHKELSTELLLRLAEACSDYVSTHQAREDTAANLHKCRCQIEQLVEQFRCELFGND